VPTFWNCTVANTNILIWEPALYVLLRVRIQFREPSIIGTEGISEYCAERIDSHKTEEQSGVRRITRRGDPVLLPI
jgi:hypothetical protein